MEKITFTSNPEKYDFMRWQNAVNKEIESASDRAIILVITSVLDTQLKQLLEEFLLDCTETKNFLKSSLSDFSNRIDLSYCLGIISKHEYNMLHNLRRIRNNFAHKIETTSFDTDQRTIDLVKNMFIPYGMYVPNDLIVQNGKVKPFPIDIFEKAENKEKIILIFNYLFVYLNTRTLFIKKREEFEAPTQYELLKLMKEIQIEAIKKQKDLLLKAQALKEQISNTPESDKKDNLLQENQVIIDDITYISNNLEDDDIDISIQELDCYFDLIADAIFKSYNTD